MIGCRCRYGNVHSRAVLIVQTLSGEQSPKRRPEDGRRESRAGVTVATRPHPQAPRKPRRAGALERHARPPVETTVTSSKRKIKYDTYNKVSIVTLPARANALFRAIQPGSAANEPENAQRSGPHGTSHATSQVTNNKSRDKTKTDRTCHSKDVTKAVTARGLHLFPFRTEKLNPATPMVLRKWESR